MISAVLGAGDTSHVPMLLIIGFAIFAGTVGARIFQKLRIPQVVGYIIIGVILGKSSLGFIDKGALENLTSFTAFALGVIGFMIGGQLHRDVFRKYGKQFIAILLAQGTGAFLVVTVVVAGTAMLVMDLKTSIALGLLFGAIGSATAPAATVNVLWEYKTKGVLTSAIYAIVALDDALALGLFSIAASLAAVLTGMEGTGLIKMLGMAGYEIIGAGCLGVFGGLVLNMVFRRVRDHGNVLAFVIGGLALVVGVASRIKVDMILSTMVLGATLVNVAPRRSREAFETVEKFSSPIYVLFFVIAGAELDLYAMTGWMWMLAIPFMIGRVAAKILGANLGAMWVKAPRVVQKYLGMCLFCQGGVAVGLAIVARNRFGDPIGNAIMMIVTATTLIVELIGPPCVRFAVKKAGEIGLNVTEEDLMESYTVADMVDRTAPRFTEAATIGNILHTIAETSATHYPVVNRDGKLTGIIALEELKRTFGEEGLSEWLVAFDLMDPVTETVTEETPLPEAVAHMRDEKLDYVPVVGAKDHMRLTGCLELRRVERKLSQEVLRRHQLADTSLA